MTILSQWRFKEKENNRTIQSISKTQLSKAFEQISSEEKPKIIKYDKSLVFLSGKIIFGNPIRYPIGKRISTSRIISVTKLNNYIYKVQTENNSKYYLL